MARDQDKWRSARGLKRARASRDLNKMFLVVCEGEKTEPRYFEDVRRCERIRGITVKCVGLGIDPVGIVTMAERLRSERSRAARKYGDVMFDEVWAVFDMNHNPVTNIRRAMGIAEKSDIHIALSDPCFEVWLLLHHQEQRAFIRSEEVARAIMLIYPHYDKYLPYERYLSGRCHIAMTRAEALEREHQMVGKGTNPSSGAWRTIRSFLDNAR